MEIVCMALAPDGRLLASGDTAGTVRLWNADRAESVAILQGHTGAVFSLAFTSESQVVASGGADQTIRLWEASYRRRLDSSVGEVSPTKPGQFKVTLGPVLQASGRPTPLAQQELTQAVLGAQLVSLGIRPRADQVAQRLVRLVRHPHRSQITTAQQTGELECVAPIGLDLVARSFRYQRRRRICEV
jgi:hypothetical protein